MAEFITIDESAKDKKAVLWAESNGKCQPVSLHVELDDVPGHEDLAVYRFDVPTTLAIRGAANSGKHPLLDADGAPLWNGARIEFRLRSHHVNTHRGSGEFTASDELGGVQYVSDRVLNVYGPNGFCVDRRREQYAAASRYQYEGDFKGCSVCSSKLGDPHEHGEVSTFIRLVDDPRKVCTLVPPPPAPTR